MVYLKIKERKAGEYGKGTQHPCLTGAWSRRGQGVREAAEGEEVSLGTDGGSWIPGPGNSSGIESILTQAPVGMWGNCGEPRGDALGLVLLSPKPALHRDLAGCDPGRSSASNALTPLCLSSVENDKGVKLGAEKRL